MRIFSLWACGLVLTCSVVSPHTRTAPETCVLSGERVEGATHLCFYDCPSGNTIMTVGEFQLCPLTLRR